MDLQLAFDLEHLFIIILLHLRIFQKIALIDLWPDQKEPLPTGWTVVHLAASWRKVYLVQHAVIGSQENEPCPFWNLLLFDIN